ncbi:hypothetical protein JB92DRAFT_2824501 [Gautieria morchelliformis]|nr:hypothetical protein JB92DRAFT_2824501 [Gautieria morchelliformis]
MAQARGRRVLRLHGREPRERRGMRAVGGGRARCAGREGDALERVIRVDGGTGGWRMLAIPRRGRTSQGDMGQVWDQRAGKQPGPGPGDADAKWDSEPDQTRMRRAFDAAATHRAGLLRVP